MDSGSPVLKGLTVLLFAALAAVAFGVFVVLPERVEERPPPPRTDGLVEAPPEPSPPAPLPGGEGSRTPAPPEAPARSQPPLSPPEAPARSQPPPFEKGGTEGGFIEAMSAGLAALGRQDFAAARDAFERAERLRPGSPEAADGLLRAAAGQRRATVAEHRRRAEAFENAEEWHRALQHYEAALAVDATLAFAREGRRRAAARAELAERLDYHLANPRRLGDAAVLREASELVDRAAEAAPAGPRHQRRTAELRRLVEAYSTPVRAVLRSDGATEVMVYKVGRLGTFAERALELRPGTYTVVGHRRGYRDVRHQLVVEPGREPEPLVVRCEEEI